MNQTAERKITKATFKSFVRKNLEKLFIKSMSEFDGMTDCVEFKRGAIFLPAVRAEESLGAYTLGLRGVWLVGQSRDRFQTYEDELFSGIAVSNCCGSFIVAVKK